MKEVHMYFRKRPRVVMLDLLAIESIITPFLAPQGTHVLVSDAAQQFGARMAALLEQAQTELITTCTAFDIGLSMLTAEPEFVDEPIALCYATGFPYGYKAYGSLLGLGLEMSDIPSAALSVQNIHMQTIALLHHLARGETINRVDMLQSDAMWTQAEWDEYFATFPNDEFRIPVIAAARALFKKVPSAFSDHSYRLFARHFQPRKERIFETQSWQDADRQKRDEESAGY